MKTSEIAKLLENYMKTEGINQVVLAERLEWTPANVNDILKERVPVGIKRLLHIAKKLGLTFEIGGDEVLGEPVPPPIGTIPVLVLAKGGPRGFYDEQGYPVGEGFKKVKRPYDLTDPHAYGVEVRGNSMTPKFESGEIVLVSPRKQVASGDYVVLKTVKGEVMVKRIRFQNDLVILESFNEPTRVLPREEIAFCHKIVWVKQKG